MAYKIAGGTKWWQVRAGSGVEAEWIVMKKDWKDFQAHSQAQAHTHSQGPGEGVGAGNETPKKGSRSKTKHHAEDVEENGHCE